MINEDSKGQLELDNIDTPVGAAAEHFLQATAEVHKVQAAKDEAQESLIDEMKKANIRTLKFKGDTLRYKPGHQTPEKIQFVRS